MAIPNPNPNIEDGKKCDNKTYSSNKIESLIATATELPTPEAGDAGKVLTVNSDGDGYELDYAGSDLIDDNTASYDTVYSSSKVDSLLSAKANSDDVDNSIITITRKPGVPDTVPIPTVLRRGHVVIICFSHELPAGTYTAATQGGTWQISPAPISQIFSMISCNGTPTITVRSDGTVGFNGNLILNSPTYAIGELVYITSD